MADEYEHTNHLGVYFTGVNPETFDRDDDAIADEDGHLISGTVIKRPSENSSLVPVHVRVGHGVAAGTAATMLRKIADMIESNPTFTSSRAGSAIRKETDGSYTKRQLTIAGMLAAAEQMPPEDRARLHKIIDQIRIQIDDPKKDGPSDSDMML